MQTEAAPPLPVPGEASQSDPASASAAGQCPAHWRAIVDRHHRARAGRATWQLVSTVGLYLLTWTAIFFATDVSWWIVMPLAVLAGMLLVRVFIIFHDCGHGSFFASRRANDFWGGVIGVLAFTPYYHWRGEHAIHHGCTGDLDRRGIGDIWTMTVQEYLDASVWRRFSYRLARSPFVLFVVAPLALLLVIQRVPRAKAGRRERRSVWWMNLALLFYVAGMVWLFGAVPFLVVQLTVFMVGGALGVWLFYLQHQFESAYWERSEDWDYEKAALVGSSFLRLPRILQWFSGNIGFHHIHHLSPRIPNYNLEACHRSDPMFRAVKAMTIWGAIRVLGLKLWDESSKRLVGFAHLRTLRRGFAARDDEGERGGGDPGSCSK